MFLTLPPPDCPVSGHKKQYCYRIEGSIETWEEKVNRLARHGDAYRLPEAFKKVALKAMLVGKIKDNYELWEADKLSFE